MAEFPSNLTPEGFKEYMKAIQVEQYIKDITCKISYNNVITLSKPLPLGFGIGAALDGSEVFTYVNGKKWIIPQSE